MSLKKMILAAMLMVTVFSCSDDSTTTVESEDGGSSDIIVAKSNAGEMNDMDFAVSDEAYIDGGDYNYVPEYVGDGEVTEVVEELNENDFIKTADSTMSTFSIDVDNAAYTFAAQQVGYGNIPTANLIRIEEFINYFEYAYPTPTDGAPFEIISMVGDCPWNAKHKLAHIALQGKEADILSMPSNNLVLLIDVSGSMKSKIQLLKNSFVKMMEANFTENDFVSIVTYAGYTEVALESVSCSAKNKEKIISVLEGLTSGGGTNGGAGIVLAYEQAAKNFISNGNNRVILATDGDFNLGQSSDEELVTMIEEKRETGVYLSVLGFGMNGYYGDAKMEKITNAGNGNYFYISNEIEADKVLGRDLFSNIQVIAKDVKIQVEFNDARVAEYRLIGYENRVLANADFDNDVVDAGEIGPGHSVTALYELVMKEESTAGSIFDVRLRYKEPDEDASKLIEKSIDTYDVGTLETEFNFAAAVAEFGLILKRSKYMGDATYEAVKLLASDNLGTDEYSLRANFLTFVENASNIVIEPIVEEPVVDTMPTPLPKVDDEPTTMPIDDVYFD